MVYRIAGGIFFVLMGSVIFGLDVIGLSEVTGIAGIVAGIALLAGL